MKYTQFTLYDWIFFSAYLILFSLITILIYLKNKENPEYRYFLPHFFWKILMGFAMAYVYVYNYGGGDTTAYWQGADTLNNLFYESPLDYLTEIFSSPTKDYIPHYYNQKTGVPPMWIYNEPNSWFICKLSSPLSFFSFKSYLALNLFYSILTTIISWKFFRFLNSYLSIQSKYIAYAILFIPTVGFWCTGIMKDSVTYASLLVVIMGIFKILNKQSSFIVIISTLIGLSFIYVTRSFLLLPILIPVFILFVFRLNKNKPAITKFLTRLFGISIALSSIVFFMSSASFLGEFTSENLTKSANTIYLDFQNNTNYTGKRYNLGISEVNSTTMVTVIPNAILTTIYRPFLWEADNALMVINGLESSIFLTLTLSIFRRRREKANLINLIDDTKTKNFLIFSLLFVLILAYFVGLTSGLFGVLARLKAPILPFFLLYIFSKVDRNRKQNLTISE
ncbi:hypothetical protein [Fluviicola taffensis]|uniref:Glycosyltransferase RgtA/B/C/D-like domain-containing protein n=1 Tax=Fluviicola taffensis (strain DSM 16823 / NCIMB 13979 / RW262) TaxID=755732 RepID=F2II19_FLUTR|nr:hypothetical protein [Fluviicola taffensis]AEA42719.1 hypothetical protein Fluta_0715 [Fluviicola taffensis DSM 16823]